MDSPLFYIPLALLVVFIFYKLFHKSPGETDNWFMCGARRIARRWSWAYLFLSGLLLYPLEQYALIRWQASQVPGSDKAEAAAIAAAKVVDTLQVYSKFSIAIGSFCLINFMAWAALNMVMPVLPDWAKGDYAKSENAKVVGTEADYVVGFKRTFLNLDGAGRIKIFFVALGLELFVGCIAVYAAFNIQ